jgi:hypothetical protein
MNGIRPRRRGTSPLLIWIVAHGAFAYALPTQCLWDPTLVFNQDLATTCLPVHKDNSISLRDKDVLSAPPYCDKSSASAPETLCVYTFMSGRSDEGISILTTPEVASAAIGIFITADQGWDYTQSFHLATQTPRLYKTVDPAQGKGVVASREIGQEEIIMAEFPSSIVINSRFVSVEPDVKRGLFQRAFEQLPVADRTGILEVSPSADTKDLESISSTRGLGITIGGKEHMAIFPTISVSALGFMPKDIANLQRRKLNIPVGRSKVLFLTYFGEVVLT